MAKEDLSVFTDDCSVAEADGMTVRIVEGNYNNIKITTQEDIAIAEGVLGFGGKEC
jgi:2-C-methyl-D-erythritol 4-phosphate cytidylyltransferase